MTKVIKALIHKKRGIGKHIKNTKMLYEWKFKIDETPYTILLYHSVWSLKHKVQIISNRDLLKEYSCKGTKSDRFKFNYSIENLEIELKDRLKSFDLFIQKISFREIHRKNQIEIDEQKLTYSTQQKGPNRIDRLRQINKGRNTDKGFYDRENTQDKNNSGIFFDQEISYLRTNDYSENKQLVRQINFSSYNQPPFINSKIASSFASILNTSDCQTATIFFKAFQRSNLVSNNIQSSSYITFNTSYCYVNVLFKYFSLVFYLNL